MTNKIDSDMFWARDVIGQAQGIIMNRCEIDAGCALGVLRKMSLNTGTQMCVVAEQVVNHNVPVDAERTIEEDLLGFGRPRNRPAGNSNT